MDLDVRYEKKCTLIANFLDYCKEINRPVALVLSFILLHLKTEGSLTKENYLKLKGTYDANVIKNVFTSIASLQGNDANILKKLDELLKMSCSCYEKLSKLIEEQVPSNGEEMFKLGKNI
jgi:translation initiation factor 2 beta subunit (eIF-2beta)/eIF-5